MQLLLSYHRGPAGNAEQRQENRDGSRDNMRSRRGRAGPVSGAGDQNEQALDANECGPVDQTRI